MKVAFAVESTIQNRTMCVSTVKLLKQRDQVRSRSGMIVVTFAVMFTVGWSSDILSALPMIRLWSAGREVDQECEPSWLINGDVVGANSVVAPLRR